MKKNLALKIIKKLIFFAKNDTLFIYNKQRFKMKKIFYKLFILGGLLTSTTLIHSSKTNKKDFGPENKITQKETKEPSIQEQAKPLNDKKQEEPIQVQENQKKSQKISEPVITFLKSLTPLLKRDPFLKHLPEIQLPSKEDVVNFIEHQKQLIQEEEIASRYNLTRSLMAPTYLIESTRYSVDNNNVVHSKPMECFYFCSANALTIGYGLKIEFNGDKLAPEGIEALRSLDITINGRHLSQEEKKNLAYQCIKKRNDYDKSHSPNLSQMRYEAQVDILFPNDRPIISTENALASAQIEYSEKQENLLRRNPFLGNSFYSQALGTDLAYQYGNAGVTKCSYYKCAKKNTLASQIVAGHADRLKVRKFLCALAYKHWQDQTKRKSKPITPAEQNEFTLFAIQKYFELFKDGIMSRSPYHILLMEKMMTLVMMQHQQDIQTMPLYSFQIKECEKQAHQLVYHDLFFSSTITQLPKKLQPITMVDAVKGARKSLTPWLKKSELSLTPDAFMEKILLPEAEKKIKVYNKKYKKNIAIQKIPANKKNMVTNGGSER